jgi:hypothetical protein
MSVAAQSLSTPAESGHAARAWWPGAAARASSIAALALAGILTHLALRWGSDVSPAAKALPLYVVLVGGGVPLVLSLALKLVRREFGSDLLAGISIVAAVLLQEYLAGALVVLMLSGGEALEAFALGRASSVLQALARRMPLVAHRRIHRQVAEVQLADVRVGDELIVYPHEICPVDGVIVEGHGVMDESYLTGEPFMMPKAPGSEVFSGAINGENALTLRASRLAVDSRYARIMSVMRDSEQRRPQIRRLGDQLGAWYTPIALGGRRRMDVERRSRALPGRPRGGDAVSVIDRHSCRDHRRHLAGRQTEHHHSRSRGTRTRRSMSHDCARQDGNLDLRRARTDGTVHRARHGRCAGAAGDGEPGTLLEAPVGKARARSGETGTPRPR